MFPGRASMWWESTLAATGAAHLFLMSFPATIDDYLNILSNSHVFFMSSCGGSNALKVSNRLLERILREVCQQFCLIFAPQNEFLSTH